MMYLGSCSQGRTAAAAAAAAGTIRLLCPTTVSSSNCSNLVYFPVSSSIGGGGDERGIDLGAIARAFRLQPSTVRLNGHLLGTRAPDHVSSVTWKSLLSFFSARGFPTGCGDREPIIVHGKPNTQASGECVKRKLQLEAKIPPNKKRTVKCNSTALEDGDDLSSEGSILCIKRKLKLEDDNPLKKKKMFELNSGSSHETPKLSTSVPKIGFTYNCSGGPRKRPREDEMILTLPCKRAA